MSKFQCDNDNEHIKLQMYLTEIKRSAVQTLYQGNNQLISIFQEEFPPLDTTKDTTIERMLEVTGDVFHKYPVMKLFNWNSSSRYADKEPALDILLPWIHVTLFQIQLRNNMIPKKEVIIGHNLSIVLIQT